MDLLKEFSRRFFRSRLVISSFIMITGTVVAGVGNYLYHFFMGRMLGPADYGVLVSLISLSYLLGIPVSALNLVIIKFVSTLKGREEIGAIRVLFKNLNKKLLPFSLLILLIFLFLSPLIASFLHLPSSLPFIIILIAFFVGIFAMVNRATLQGLLRFPHLAVNDVLGVLVKLIVAITLVFWGLKVYGALFGFLIGGIAGYLFTLFLLRFLFQTKPQKLELHSREMFNFALPAFFSILAFTSLYTSDVILVRHFFSGQQSGFYGALSTLGKVIFFAASPVVSVAFPMISERYANGGKYRNLLWASLGLVGVICLFATGAYFLFPVLIIKLLFGKTYLPAASLLGYFGIFLSLYSLSFLLVNFCLSIKKTKVVVLPVMAAALQIILIWFFHQNFQQLIWISITITALLLVSLTGFLLKYKPKI